MKMLIAACCLAALCVAVPAGARDFIPLPDGFVGPEDISGVEIHGKEIVLGSDEVSEDMVSVVQFLEPDGSRRITPVLKGDRENGEEMDIEGLALDGGFLYVLGSHCRSRKKVKKKYSVAKNHKRLTMAGIREEKNRAWIYRLDLEGKAGPERISLRPILEKDPVLAVFCPVPSKENGVDIEGLAVRGGQLFAGFRGPVLRGGYVPVMVFSFDRPEDHELRFLDLGGRGVRGMDTVEDGFLVLAGFSKRSFQVYLWDGKDAVPGVDREEAPGLRLLAELDPPDGAKAEGIAVEQETESGYQVVLVYDGASQEQVMERITLPKAGR